MRSLEGVVPRHVIAFAAAAFLAATGDAKACECALAGIPFLPLAGSTAPTNTRIWTSLDSATISIIDRDGALPASRTTLGFPAGRVIVWTPARELAANSTVNVSIDGQEFSFTTAGGPDLEAPEPPTVEHITTFSFPGLPTCFSLGERVQSAQIDIRSDGTINLADVNGSSMLNEVLIDGTVSDLRTADPISLSEVCGNWPGGEAARLRVSTFDLAGNFSTWSRERRVVMPPVGRFDACSCGTLGAGHNPFGLFNISLAALVARRRQTRPDRKPC